MRIATGVTALLGIDFPILASGSADQAGAVSEAGGLGIVTAEGPGLHALAAAIDRVQAGTSRPFGIRLPPDAPEEWLGLVPARPGVVVLTAGDGHRYGGRFRSAGARHLHGVADAQQALRCGGVDGFLVEGGRVEGSGWEGVRALAGLVPGVPLVAPDVLDGAGLAAALALGAGAAQFDCGPSEAGGDLVRRVVAGYVAAVRALPALSVTPPRDSGRMSREAAALRENLRKRKEQARARAAGS